MLRRAFPDVYEGWLVVGSSAFVVLLIAATFFYGFGTIFNEVVLEFGWSVGATSLAFSLRSEVGGVAAPFIGAFIDRAGPGRVLILGIIVAAIGVVAMSFMQSLWQFYVAMFVIALGTSSAGGQVGLAAIATWFRVRRAQAMSIMTLGGGLGGVLVVGVAALVDAFGWRWALRVLALGMVTVGMVAALNVRARPPGHPQPMDGLRARDWREGDDEIADWGVPIRAVVRSPAFLLLALAFILNNFGTTAIIVHQIPYLEREIGASKAVAGSTVAIFTLTSIVGRLGFGLLADRYSKRLMMALAMSLVVIGLPLLALATELWQAMLAIVLIAPGFGGTIPVRPAILADYFGTKTFGTINGIMSLAQTTGGAIGPWIVGVVVDRTGSYDVGWWISAGVVALAVPVVLLASPPTELAERFRPPPAPVRPPEPPPSAPAAR